MAETPAPLTGMARRRRSFTHMQLRGRLAALEREKDELKKSIAQVSLLLDPLERKLKLAVLNNRYAAIFRDW